MIDSNANSDVEAAAEIKFQGDNGPSSDETLILPPTPLPFETLLDALPCPVYYQDTQGVFLGYNKSFSNQILDNSAPCLIGKSIADLKGHIPDDLRFDVIASNLPAHVGKELLYLILSV